MAHEIETFGQTRLKEHIISDIEATRGWAHKQQRIEERRHGQRPRRKLKPYKGAPNFVDPIIDDNVTEKTDQEISMLWNAPRIVNVLSLSDMKLEHLTMIANAFDTYVRHIIKIRVRLEQGLDMKNSRGFTVVKNVRRFNSILKKEVPDILMIDNLRVIVPPDTIVGEEERITHIYQLTPRQLRVRARQKGWKNVEAIINQAKELANATDDDDHEARRTIHETLRTVMGIDESDHDEFITIAEIYHYADNDESRDLGNVNKIMGRVKPGNKMVTIFPLHFPNMKLTSFAWRTPDSIENIPEEEYQELVLKEQQTAEAEGRLPDTLPGVRQKDGDEKEWPFTPLRFEEKSPFWYESRGGGHKLMDDQIEATQLKNMRATMRDYFMNPLLKNVGKNLARNPANVTYEPGSVLPEGLTWQEIPGIPTDIVQGQSEIRSTAGKRMGTVGQSNFSSDFGNRKLQKTATEISSENARAATLSSASVDRFNEPLSRPFQLMWEDIKRMRVILPIIMPNGQFRQLEEVVFDADVLIIPAASAKTLNPDLQLLKAREVADFALQFIPLGVPVDPEKVLNWVLTHYDPQIAMQFVKDPNEPGEQGQPPINMVLQDIQQKLDKLAQAGGDLFDEVSGIQKLAIENADRISDFEEREMKERSSEPAQAV